MVRAMARSHPLMLRLDSEMSSDFLKRHLLLPAPDEPLQNIARLLVGLGAEQGASFELALGIPVVRQ